MPFSETQILIAHPGKHHVLHIVAGCVKIGVSVKFMTPFYSSGFGKIISMLPGSIGKRAEGYFHPDIPIQSIYSPIWWQFKKLSSFYGSGKDYEKWFDEVVANLIKKQKVKAEILITLQDYMPKTVKSAKEKGIKIWSDQILNQSDTVTSRINKHENFLKIRSNWKHNEQKNIEILSASDIVTIPSKYCLEGINNHIIKNTKLYRVPYGVDQNKFKSSMTQRPKKAIILARAHTIRKGGHLLLFALKKYSEKYVTEDNAKEIKVTILGKLDKELETILEELNLPQNIHVTHGTIPHSVVQKLYNESTLFIMPSLSESMSLACIEAMQAGLPLIITRFCGIDGFEHNKMGYEVKDNVETLASALENAINNIHLWNQWGENARLLAKTLTWENYEYRIGEIAKEVLH